VSRADVDVDVEMTREQVHCFYRTELRYLAQLHGVVTNEPFLEHLAELLTRNDPDWKRTP